MAGTAYETMEGNSIVIGCDGDSLTVNGIKMVRKKDIVTTNGVIHLIDQVLMPDSGKKLISTSSCVVWIGWNFPVIHISMMLGFLLPFKLSRWWNWWVVPSPPLVTWCLRWALLLPWDQRLSTLYWLHSTVLSAVSLTISSHICFPLRWMNINRGSSNTNSQGNIFKFLLTCWLISGTYSMDEIVDLLSYSISFISCETGYLLPKFLDYCLLPY